MVIVGIGVPQINQYGGKPEEPNIENSNDTTTSDTEVKEEAGEGEQITIVVQDNVTVVQKDGSIFDYDELEPNIKNSDLAIGSFVWVGFQKYDYVEGNDKYNQIFAYHVVEREDTTAMDKEPMVELTLEEAIVNEKFGNLFPSSILDGYILQDTITILNHTVLVASFYNEELEDELTIRIAKKSWFQSQQKDLELNTILYREKNSGISSYIYIAGEENIVQYMFSNTDIADNEKFYEMVYSASYFHKCIEYADSTDKGFPNWGLTLSVKDVTEFGLTLVCTQSGGEPTGELQTGSDYHLIILKDGTWKDVPTIMEEYGWNTMAYIIEKNDSTEFEINWEWLYGKLPTGTYRLTKGFTDFRKSGDYDNFTYWTEFEIK